VPRKEGIQENIHELDVDDLLCVDAQLVSQLTDADYPESERLFGTQAGAL